ncbi:MAG: DUF692 family protein [Anaerolineae bacterium]|nr:DUF692 domain-containing protein [Caldilineales bacterium]MDW8269190.1 DUF692 family protein [Anaerolineae bacterium]
MTAVCRFALNYSSQAAELVRTGRLQLDLFKCPPWPEMVATAARVLPVYIHFPLAVGLGQGDAVEAHRHRGYVPADWAAVEDWLRRTDTAYVNLHLEDFDADDKRLTGQARAERLIEAAIADVEAVVRRFGAERVILENDHGNEVEDPAVLAPEVIAAVVAATGCGLLLDVSHARLAARRLGMDARAYIARLPLAATREIHLTGIQPFGSPWAERMRANGVPPEVVARYEGRLLDHLPLTETDWAFMAWAADELRAGRWGDPRVIAVECGGEGPIWQALTDADSLAEQVPRLRALMMVDSR